MSNKCSLISSTNFHCIGISTLALHKELVTNYGEGGATKREGRASEVLPHQKGGVGGGAEKDLAMLKEGQNKFWGSFLQVLAILKGGGAHKF